VITAAARNTQPGIRIRLPSEKEQHEKHQSADPVLQDEFPYERQVEVIPQSEDLEDR
jgi:hypothetical protein